MRFSLKGWLINISLILMLFSMLSCGSGGGSGSGGVPPEEKAGSPPANNIGQNSGSVALLFTDGATTLFSEIIIDIAKIELLSNTSRVTVFTGTKTIDLLDLKNETSLFSVDTNVPEGSYDKIRLTVTSVNLKDLNGNNIPPHEVKLPGNNKIDLVPKNPFVVRAGEMIAIRLDIDAEKSIHIVSHPIKHKYNFRPVVFIDVLNGLLPGKIIRAIGTVRNIDSINNTFQLCPTGSSSNSYTVNSGSASGNGCCITVQVEPGTSFFDSGDQGKPAMFGALTEGSTATVIGSHMMLTSNSTSCNIGLSAVVVEIGQFLKLNGNINSSVDPVTNQFVFDIDPGQGVSAVPVAVQIQQGTKIYSHKGDILDISDIQTNRKAEIDGFLVLDPVADILNAAFISVDTSSVLPVKLSGDIDNIDYTNETFDLVAGQSIVSCVEVQPGTLIIEIEDLNNSYTSRLINFTDLDNGDTADLYGTDYDSVSGCFKPDTIIKFKIIQP